MSVKVEVLIALAAATEPLHRAQLLEQLGNQRTMSQVGPALSELKAQELIEPVGKSEPAEGERVMSTWVITAAGREVVAAGDAKTIRRVSGKRKAKPKPAGRSQKPGLASWVKGRRAKGAHKAKRKAKHAGSRAARKAWKTRRAAAARAAAVPVIVKEPVSRWAFTADESLLLMGGSGAPIEIPKPAVRALITFLEKMDNAFDLLAGH